MSADARSLLGRVRRYPYAVACLVLMGVLAAGAGFLWIQNNQLRVMQQERAQEGEAMLAMLVGGSVQREELAAARAVTRRIDENLVVERNLAENTWYFFKLEEQTKARLPELHQLSAPVADKSTLYKRIPYTLRVVGSHGEVAAFLRALETGPRLVNVTAFSCAKNDPSGATLTLDLSVDLLGKK